MEIINSSIEDIDKIFFLYDDAIEYQKKVFYKHWGDFERSLIEREIKENRLWKMIIANEMACVFSLSFNDSLFWKEKDKQPSVYIHRIAINSKFRGSGFILSIMEWARQYCKTNGKEFIRMDTWGDNPKLINYYVKCGFNHVDTVILDKIEGLPIHYIKNETLALLELKV